MFRVLTLFTDASHNPDLKTVGGAWWAKCDGFQLTRQSCGHNVPTSTEAELKVTCGAIKSLLQRPEFLAWQAASPTPVLLVVVVDCMAVKDAFAHPLRRLGRMTQEARDLAASVGVLIQVNHVPGHRGISTPRAWVNNWCDRMAKAARKTLEGVTA